jgi:DNA polymerase III delta prime subunit
MNNIILEWPYKHVPQKLDDMVLNTDTRRDLEKIMETPGISSFLLSGSAGVGKGSFIDIYLKDRDVDYLKINASMERNIDDVRDKIRQYAETMSVGDFKVVYLNEMDNLTIAAQKALRDLQERVHKITRFVYACNYFEYVIPELVSRSKVIIFKNPDIKDVLLKCYKILKAEGIKSIDNVELGKLVKTYYPDIRACINALELYSDIKTKQFVKFTGTREDYGSDIINLLFEMDANKIRQILKTHVSNNMYGDLYKSFYENMGKFGKNAAKAMLIIGEHAYRNDNTMMKEINFMTMVFKLVSDGLVR